MWFCEACARDSAPCQKWVKCEGFVAFPKTLAGVGHLKRICKDAFRVVGAIQETCSSEMLGGPGADFLRGGCILEHQIFRSAKMILRDRCSTLLRDKHNTLDRWNGKIAKRIGTRLSALRKSRRLASFWCCQLEAMRKSRRILSFLTLSSSKIEEVSQNCCFFDVVTFENGGSLAELLLFQAFRLKIDR